MTIASATPIYPRCSNCGEYRGLEHDGQRCWAIAHAFAVSRDGREHCEEHNHHIAELARWLQGHPGQRDSQQYRDRQQSLDRWIAKAKLLGDR